MAFLYYLRGENVCLLNDFFLSSIPKDTRSRNKTEDPSSSWSSRWSNIFLFKLLPCYSPWWRRQEWLHNSSKELIGFFVTSIAFYEKCFREL